MATAGAVAVARRQASDEYRDGFWGRLFPGQIPQPVIPDELVGETITLEGHELRVVDTGRTDTEGTSVLWVPDLRLLVAGHMQPRDDDDPRNIGDSIQFLTDFDESAASARTAEELYAAVLHKHPRRANPGSLWGAAKLSKTVEVGD